MIIKNNKCEFIDDEGKGNTVIFEELRKTTDKYECVMKQEKNNLKLTNRFEIDRYSGVSKLTHYYMLGGFGGKEFQQIYQCEKKLEKKF